jgi:hypothetical protein
MIFNQGIKTIEINGKIQINNIENVCFMIAPRIKKRNAY